MPKIYRISKVIELTGLSRATIYRLVDKKTFPKPFKIIGRLKGWSDSDIENWIQDKINQGKDEVA